MGEIESEKKLAFRANLFCFFFFFFWGGGVDGRV